MRLTVVNSQQGNRLERVKSPPTGRAGIDVEDTVPPLIYLPVAMAEDDYLAGRSLSRISQLVDDVEGDAGKLKVEASRQSERQGQVVVALDGVQGRDSAKAFEDQPAANVPGVDDRLDAGEG
jgi:hypothetical protein